MNEIVKLYQEKAESGDPAFVERLEKVMEKRDALKKARLTDTAAKKPALANRGTPVSGHRYRAQKSSPLEIDDAISDIFQDATGHDTGMMPQMRSAKHRSRTNNEHH